jgi:modulator of FtsH protease HflK
VNDQTQHPSGRPEGARHASVTLREAGAERDQGPQLDPANQSLADALGLVFRLLQVAMLGLFVYFALSGFQSIRENEKGVRLVFGRKAGVDLPPGLQFSWPYPVGELVRVDTGEQPLNLNESFWPMLDENQKKLSLEQLARQGSWYGMKPERDGSLITGDANLVHTQWQVRYTRRDAAAWIENVLDVETERRLVQAAVERGVLQAVAQTRIDDLMKTASESGSTAERAKEIAQETLSRVNSGLQIDQLTMTQRVAPLAVYNDFSGVQSAEQNAGKMRDNAESQARDILNRAAGAAHPYLIRQIDLYEQAVARNDAPEQERIMETIRALMDGRPAQLGDETVVNVASGRVKDLINSARSYRTTVASQAESDLATYKVKWEQFQANPDVVIQGEWLEAMSKLLDRDTTDIYRLPPLTRTLELWLNRDATDEKDRQEALKRKRIEAAELRKAQEANEARFRTNTDYQIVNPG